jgi:hypothetical protein
VGVSHGPEAGALDVTFLGCAGIVDRGIVCGLLTGDVHFTMLVLHILAFYCFVPNSHLFFDRLFL